MRALVNALHFYKELISSVVSTGVDMKICMSPAEANTGSRI